MDWLVRDLLELIGALFRFTLHVVTHRLQRKKPKKYSSFKRQNGKTLWDAGAQSLIDTALGICILGIIFLIIFLITSVSPDF